MVPSTVALIGGFKVHRMAADGDGEVRSRSLPFDFNLFQHAAKLSLRRQDAADPLEHSQVGLVEGVVRRERSLAGIVRAPGAETALGVDLARRNRVGELRRERRRPVKSDGCMTRW